jgi:hypothetical protein
MMPIAGNRYWKSATDFDRDLELSVCESNRGSDVLNYYDGFVNLEQAQRFAKWWIERTGRAYFPYAWAEIEPITQNPIVRTKRSHSCD